MRALAFFAVNPPKYECTPRSCARGRPRIERGLGHRTDNSSYNAESTCVISPSLLKLNAKGGKASARSSTTKQDYYRSNNNNYSCVIDSIKNDTINSSNN